MSEIISGADSVGGHVGGVVTTTTKHGGTKRGIDVNSLSAGFLIEVEKGNVPGHLLIKKFGASDAIGTTLVPVAAGNVYQTPSTLTSLEIVSDDNTNDIAGGDGARTVRIWGLNNINGSWTEDIQDVALNGTTPVVIPNQMFRVYKMRVIDSGTYASQSAPSHNSTITLRVASAGATWATVNTYNSSFGLSATEIGVYSIPKGMTAYLIHVHFDIEGNKVVDVIGFKREGADVITAPFTPMTTFYVKRNIEGEHQTGDGYALQTIVGPADIGFMARHSSGIAKVEVEFVLLCVEDGY